VIAAAGTAGQIPPKGEQAELKPTRKKGPVKLLIQAEREILRKELEEDERRKDSDWRAHAGAAVDSSSAGFARTLVH
jgi:hypothetical protein